MATLFDEGSSEDEGKLKINQSYADKYNQWREKEEYQKLKDKYGESTALQLVADDDVNSSSSESEEDEGDAWDSDVEKRFFHTLASLKTKDPSIYNAEKKFFDKNAAGNALVPKKKQRNDEKITLRDYERQLILERGGKIDEDEDVPKTFNEEQEEIKKGFQELLQNSDCGEEEDLLIIRPKNATQKEKEEEEYKEWLKGQKKDISNEEMKKKLKPLKDYWSDPKLDESEKFLKDFFLNKRYKESEDKNYIPTYDEVVHDSEGDLSEDEKTLEKQLEFEHKYNFRFEEPDPEFIKRYPRTIENSMRRPDTRRKQKRDEVKERKQKQKEEKKEELKQLKKYKLKEIQEKLEQLKTITGNPSLPFQDEDLEEDFNPEKHDQKMKEIFDQEYYGVDEGDQKPEFPFDPEIDDENWDAYTGDAIEAGPSDATYDQEPHCEDPDFNMDCDFEDNQQSQMKEMVEMTRRNRGRRKSLFAKKLESKKPVFDPQQHPNYEEYLEEYYKLDYEDIIGDQPVRFKYRSVLPNDFGLETEEILAARDKELNQWCSVKKMSQYRTEYEEMQDVHAFKSKQRNEKLKKRVLPSLFAENPEELLIEDQESARKKRRKCLGKEEEPHTAGLITHESTDEPIPKKKRKNKGKEYQVEGSDMQGTEAVPSTNNGVPKEAGGTDVLPREKRKRVLDPQKEKTNPLHNASTSPLSKITKREGRQAEVNTVAVVEATGAATTSNDPSKKKKRKKKKKKGSTSQNAPSMSTVAVKRTKKSSSVNGMDISDERLQAYGLNPKKFKNFLKYGKGSHTK